MQAAGRAEELGRLVGGQAVPVVDREGARAVGQSIGGGRAGVRDRQRVVVVAVEEHDRAEAHRRQADRDVLDECHERRDPQVDHAGEAGMRVRQPVADRWRDRRTDLRRHASGDLGRARWCRSTAGRAGPCCSVEPIGTMTVVCSATNASTSGLVISPRNTVGRFMPALLVASRSGDGGRQLADALDPAGDDVTRPGGGGPGPAGSARRGGRPGRDQVARSRAGRGG